MFLAFVWQLHKNGDVKWPKHVALTTMTMPFQDLLKPGVTNVDTRGPIVEYLTI